MSSAATIVTIKPLYLGREEAAKFLAISTSTLEGMVSKGLAPKPRKVSAGRAAWLVEELEAWGRARPHSDMLPAPDSGYGRAGKPLPTSGNRMEVEWVTSSASK